MKAPWHLNKCIICLQSHPFTGLEHPEFTEEHIIPEALGGILTCKFLCKSCNDRLGHQIDAPAKSDPNIRKTINSFKDILPDLHKTMENRQPYKIGAGGKTLPAKFQDGQIIGHPARLDGDLWVGPEETEKILRIKLSKAGLANDEIEHSLVRYFSAPEQIPVDLGGGITATSHPSFDLGPDFSKGKVLNPLLALKCVYEFSVLCFGEPLLENHFPFDEIRRALRENGSATCAFKVESVPSKEKERIPFHEIAFEGNNPHAVFQLRLFSNLAYRVHFHGVAIDASRPSYTHILNTGEDGICRRD